MIKRILICTMMTLAILPVIRSPSWADERPGLQGSDRYKGKKILWVDSYHQGYKWSDGVENGIRDVLQKTGVDLRIFRMDTKRNDSEVFGKEAGLRAKAVLETFKPDVVIASDDNAQKYFVVPYLKDTNIPVVFSAVNWDASMYGYPWNNATGMIEIDLVGELVQHFKQNARGDRIGYLGTDVETERKISDFLNKHFFEGKMKIYLVKTFEEFKKEFLRAQEEVDMLFIYNYNGITGWDARLAARFLLRNTRIPTGSPLQFMENFVVYVLGKYPEEQGEYSARTAMKILDGAKPSDFPLVTNKQAKLTVNLKMAKSAGIVFPVSVLKTANVIGSETLDEVTASERLEPGRYTGKKILWVDSYHQGYEWSDGIEEGIREVLLETGVDLRIVRLDTKRNDSEKFGRESGLRAKAILESFQPNIVIASDDNAQKYFVLPYLKDTDIPVVFSGVNWDASMYGYPCKNITGMVEVEPTEELVALFKQFTKGERIGYLSGDVETERKIVDFYNKTFFAGKMKVYLVKTFEEFKNEFLHAQEDVDMLYFYNYAGILDWDAEAAKEFLARHTKVPTGSPNAFMDQFVVFTLAKLPQEQGSYPAWTALKILDGAKPTDIALTNNKRSKLTVNVRMANTAGIVLPVSILKNASVIGQKAFDRK
ncbi:MAG: ABC transporter substrate-binding protein [Syntrophobacteraceae bacterium]